MADKIEIKCECCPEIISFEEKGGKPANVVVKPADSFLAAYLQKAVHQLKVEILPTACKNCGEKCAGRIVIEKFTVKK